jgi:hypothetical protein
MDALTCKLRIKEELNFYFNPLFPSKILEESMKSELKNELLVELTTQESAAIKGGRHGADDGPGHDVGDDRGGRRNDDGPGHR